MRFSGSIWSSTPGKKSTSFQQGAFRVFQFVLPKDKPDRVAMKTPQSGENNEINRSADRRYKSTQVSQEVNFPNDSIISCHHDPAMVSNQGTWTYHEEKPTYHLKKSTTPDPFLSLTRTHKN